MKNFFIVIVIDYPIGHKGYKLLDLFTNITFTSWDQVL